MARFRFVSKGSMTVVLRGSYRKAIRNEFDEPIGMETIPPVKAVFTNGYWETDDADAAQLLQKDSVWITEVFWHPGCLPADAKDKPEMKVKAKAMADADIARKQRKKERMDRALEGNVAKDR